MGFASSLLCVRVPREVLDDGVSEVLSVLYPFQLTAIHEVGDRDMTTSLVFVRVVHCVALFRVKRHAPSACSLYPIV